MFLLVVEDERDIREAMAATLSRCGYRVAACANGAEALAYLAGVETLPDLVVLDWMMPVMSGGEMLARLADDPRTASLPVLVVSAIDRALGTRHAQIAASLAKPMRMRTLVDVVDRLCGLPRRSMLTGSVPVALPDEQTSTVRMRRPRG